jgi:hypothetical protein
VARPRAYKCQQNHEFRKASSQGYSLYLIIGLSTTIL